jgi:hypothetical protein
MNTHRDRLFATVFGTLALACCASACAAEAELSKQILHQDGWAAYDVPMAAAAGTPCCYEHRGRATTCELEGRSWTMGRDDKDRTRVDGTLTVYLRVAHGDVDKVRAFASSCAISDAALARHLDRVVPADSVAFLARLANASASRDILDEEIAALSMHADPAAVPALAQLAEPGHTRKLREQALFWLSQAGGPAGAQIIEHAATTDDDPELRAQAVFDLSQVHEADGYATIHRIAQTDRAAHVRSQALFWMAQMGDARARADITAAIGSETSDEVREQGVFALSQLKDHEADAALIALVRGNYPRKVKEQALFWLGQSGSDDAMKFLDDVLSRQARRNSEG